MKTVFVLLVALLSTHLSHASSGQQFREDTRNLAKAHKLNDQGLVNGSICGSEGWNQFIMLTSRTGKLYAVSMESFSSSGEPDGEADTAELIAVSECSKKVVRF